MNIIGKVELTVGIGSLAFPTTCYVIHGLSYPLILGVPFFTAAQAKIDFCRNIVSFCDDLIVAPIITRHEHIATVLRTVVIPPRSEALIKLKVPTINTKYVQLQGLPTLAQRNVALARSINCIRDGVVYGNVLNPTDRPIVLYRHTPLALVEVISERTHALHNAPTPCASGASVPTSVTDYEGQLKALTDMGMTLKLDELSKGERTSLVALLYKNRLVRNILEGTPRHRTHGVRH